MTPKGVTWNPTPEWKGQPAYLIGGGPSLKGFDFTVLTDRNVIGCNDAYHLGSDIVTICAFGDHGWWQRNKWKLEKFGGRIVTDSPSVLHLNLPDYEKAMRFNDGLQKGRNLGWNHSTGALAINIAISLGANEIYLLGYDCCIAPNKDHHWHNYSTHGEIRQPAILRHIKGFNRLAQDIPKSVKIYNVTDGSSKLEVFPKMNFATFLKELTSKSKAPCVS